MSKEVVFHQKGGSRKTQGCGKPQWGLQALPLSLKTHCRMLKQLAAKHSCKLGAVGCHCVADT